MAADRSRPGWRGLSPRKGTRRQGSPEIAEAFASCFSGPAGAHVLEYLRRTFLARRVPPTAPDSVLRHIEGQRSVIAHIESLLEQGMMLRRN